MEPGSFFRTARPGDALPTLSKGPIDRAQLVRYAGASGDFNRIHFDDEFARGGGFPTVIAHGMLSMAFLGELLAGLAGPTAVRRFKARFKAVTLLGDVVTCRGEIAAVRDEDGRRAVDVTVRAEKATDAGPVLTVEATATLLEPPRA